MRPVKFLIALCFVLVVGAWIDHSTSIKSPDLVSVSTNHDQVKMNAADFNWDGDVNYAVIIITPDFGGEEIQPDVGLSDLTSSEQICNKGPTTIIMT